MDEYDIREVAGVSLKASREAASVKSVMLTELEDAVLIEGYPSGAKMTPDECRKLARYLNRLASRVAARNA